MGISGTKGSLGIGLQRTKGNPAATIYHAPARVIGVGMTQNARTLGGEVSGKMWSHKSWKSGVSIDGDFEFTPRANTLGYLLRAFAGTASAVSVGDGAYRHTFQEATDTSHLPWVTLVKNISDVWAEQYLDTRVGSLRLDIPAAGVMTAAIDFAGCTPSETTVPTETWDDSPIFETTIGHVNLGGTSVGLNRVQLEFVNELTRDEQPVGSYYRDDLTLLRRSCRVMCDVTISDATIYRQVYNDGTVNWSPAVYSAELEVQLESSKYVVGSTRAKLRIVIPNVDFLTKPIVLNPAQGTIRATLTAELTLSGSSLPFYIELTNSTEKYQLTPEMLFQASLDGDLSYTTTGDVSSSLTGTGAVPYITGPFNGVQGVRIELTKDNLSTNPSLETNLNNWGNGGGHNAARAAGGQSGSWCYQATTTGPSIVINLPFSGTPVTQGQTYYLTFYHRGTGTAIGKQDRIMLYENPSAANTSNYFTYTANWTRHTIGRTIANAGQTLLCQIYNPANPYAVGEVVQFDAHQLELAAYASSYLDGSLGAGYSWSGTAHASTSTRAGGVISVPGGSWLDPARGAIFGWVAGQTTFTNLSNVLQIANADGSKIMAVRRHTGAGATRLGFYSDSAWALGSAAGAIGTAGAWKSLYFAWEPGAQYLSIDNETVVQTALADLGITSPTLYLGAAHDNTLQGNLALAEFTAYPEPLTVTQRTWLHSLGRAPVWEEF